MDNAQFRIRPALAFFAAAFLAAVFASGSSSMRFHSNGTRGVEGVRVAIDDPATSDPGPPADVGAADFTVEFWMRASAAENGAAAVTCGPNVDWIEGHIVVDRNRSHRDRKFGVSISGGRVIFGVSGDGSGDRTICGARRVLDDAWHHIAVQRRRSDGRMWIWVDGILDAEADGPDGDVSYPDDAAPGAADDPYLVFGAGKPDAGAQSRSYSGYLDEIRVSNVLRYKSSFTRPRQPFVPDEDTAALYRLDEGTGHVVGDASGAAGGPSDGQRAFAGAPTGPGWALADAAPLGNGGAVEFTLVTGGLSEPLQVLQAPNDATRLFILQQGGTIRIFEGGALLPTPFLDISTLTSDGSEQGLLSMAFDPDYASSGLFYVYYTDDIASPGDITLARYSVSGDPDVADPGSAEILLVIPHPSEANHNGGQLAFSPSDGYLYMGTGDGGGGGDVPNNAQNLGILLGKMLRIDVGGTGTVPCGQSSPAPYGVPPSNPFVGETGCDEIWSYGLRNPWRFSFDRETGDVLIGDVGQLLWEEIDYQPAGSTGGENWGWRRMEGFHCYNPGSNCNDGTLELPILEYGHGLGCSVTGGFRYRGSAIPGLYGVYLYGDYCTGRIWRADQGGGGWTSTQLLDSGYNISGWGEDLAGEVYLAHHGGEVYKLTQVPNPVPATVSLSPTAVIAGDPDFTLTVNGTGFIYPSVVRWNGSDRPTTFVSYNQVTAQIPASDLMTAGTAEVTVFSPAPAGGLSAPLTFPINLTFLDVPTSNFAYLEIAAVFNAGVTAGCGTRIYCPDLSTTRAQMAVFLLKASEGSTHTPPPCTGSFFDDVPCTGGLFDPWIEDLAARGITGGCGGGNYCPNNPVTRAQMSAFLLKTDQGSAYVPPACTGTVFLDVPCTGGLFDPWIEDLAGRGITGGCGGGNYCPASPVTRAQMAVFLVLTFGIPLP